MDFNSGDFVIGNESNRYTVTGKGVVCAVVKPLCGPYMSVVLATAYGKHCNGSLVPSFDVRKTAFSPLKKPKLS